MDYNLMTIAQIKNLLDERGIDYSEAKLKSDYIELAQLSE